MSSTVYLLRHTALDIPAGVCYGQSEMPLAASYNQELAQVRRVLSTTTMDICFSSPLQRCRRLAEDLHPDVAIDDRLLELNFGDWEMVRWEDMDRTQAAFWGNHFVTQRCPGGESFADLHQRVMGFWNELAARPPAENILVVTHGGVIRSILAHARRLPLEAAFAENIPYGAVTAVAMNS